MAYAEVSYSMSSSNETQRFSMRLFTASIPHKRREERPGVFSFEESRDLRLGAIYFSHLNLSHG
jgi:hypothetical protein